MNTLYAIGTRYLPATSHKGARMRVWQKGTPAQTIGYRHDLTPEQNHRRAALTFVGHLVQVDLHSAELDYRWVHILVPRPSDER